MNNKWLYAAGSLIVLLVLFFIYQKYRVAPGIVFEKLPLVDLNNQKTELVTSGSSYIITFGASWCSTCIKELNALKELKETTFRDVKVVVISDEETGVIGQFRDREQYPFTFLKMQDKFSQHGIHSLPTTYFVNREGEIKKETVGMIRWEDPSTLNHLLSLLR